MKITVDKFGGMFPGIPESKLSVGMAGYARDLDLRRSTLFPLRTNKTLKEAAGQTSVYAGRCFTVSSSGEHQYTEGMPGCDDTLYRSGDGAVMFASERDAAADRWTRLGFQQPVEAPAISNLDIASSDEMLGEYTSAVYTYVRNLGDRIHESAPSLPSDTILINIGNHVVVSGIEAPLPEIGVTSIRLYLYHKGTFSGGEKTNARNGGYFLAGEIAPTETSGRALFGYPTDGLTTEGYEPPPHGLRDISSWRSGQFAGLTPYNTLAFSVPNVDYAWPQASQMVFYGKAVRFIAAIRHGYVLTDEAPFVVDLNVQCGGPQCHKGEHLKVSMPCISRKSAAVFGDAVVYASPKGLVVVDGMKSTILPIWSEDKWAEMNPMTMVGCVHSGHYYGFTDRVSFAVKLDGDRRDALVHLSEQNVKAAVCSPDGRLVVSDGVSVVEMFGGTDFRTFKWKRTYRLGEWASFSAYRLGSRYQNSTVSHFADNELLVTDSEVGDGDVERIPAQSTKEFTVEIESSGEIETYEVATSVPELAK